MFAIWWAWRSLHFGEKLLLAASLLLIAFCAGASWQTVHHKISADVILQESPQANLIKWDSGASIIVDVSGAVRHPGIVQLPRGARVKDAIQKAGGALPQADTSALNLAAIANDGQQIQVDVTGHKSTFADNASTESTFSGQNSTNAKININNATEEELQSLPHIGPVMAARIIEYRKIHGNFHSADDLDNVKGIGAKTLEKLRPFVVFH